MSTATGSHGGRQPAAPEPTGRSRQRGRTRRALVTAAGQLMEAGGTPTVAEAADAAEVSRATAYRYFPSQDALLSEAALLPGLPSSQEIFSGPDAPVDVEDRVARVHEALFDLVLSKQVQFRHFMRAQLLASLQGSSGSGRPGYRIEMLEVALEPLAGELTASELDRLRNALGVLIGTEALIAMTDVLHVDAPVARAQLDWACRALVRAAREGADSA